MLRVNLLPFDMLSQGRRAPNLARTEELAIRLRPREWEALEAMRRFDSRAQRRAVSLPEAALACVDSSEPWINGTREDLEFARRELARFYEPHRRNGGSTIHGEPTHGSRLIVGVTSAELAKIERFALAVGMPVPDLVRASILWILEALAGTDGLPPTIMPIWMREQLDAEIARTG